MPLIEIRTTADAMPLDEIARARLVMAALGDAPELEASWQGATSWLMPPARPDVKGDHPSAPDGGSPITDAERRLAQAYSAVPSWLVPPRAA